MPHKVEDCHSARGERSGADVREVRQAGLWRLSFGTMLACCIQGSGVFVAEVLSRVPDSAMVQQELSSGEVLCSTLEVEAAGWGMQPTVTRAMITSVHTSMVSSYPRRVCWCFTSLHSSEPLNA